ncbi:MAG: Lar family restriction alleviation protein [Planctomycetia bacterium]|nr:Lar family restriction alleviation protein [Planctomycetia bacterium]
MEHPQWHTWKESVDPSTIKVLDELQVREKMDYEYVRELQDAMEELPKGEDICELRFVDCGESKGTLFCLDGHHRRLAAMGAGKTVWVRVWDIPRTDWGTVGVRRNCANGRRLTKAELRKAVETWFRNHPDMSDVAAAKALGIPRSTIGDIRRQCAESGTLNLSETVTGKDGKEYPRERKKPTKEQPDQGWTARCLACGRKITEAECWAEDGKVVSIGMSLDGTPEMIFCNDDCHDEWHSRQLDNAGTQILKSAGLDKDGRGDDEGPAPEKDVPEERSPSAPGSVAPDPSPSPVVNNQQLRPCPWCGKKPRIVHRTCDNRLQYIVDCKNSNCGVIARTTWCETPEQAIEIWNTRKG